MIKSDGEQHLTISDAAARFGVTVKTVRDWIIRGIIPRPPVVEHGLREIQVFPEMYIVKAKETIKKHRTEARGHRNRE